MQGQNPQVYPEPCIQCKKRRVRCDFQRPNCQRCKKDHKQCPGYIKVVQYRPGESTKQRSREPKASKENALIPTKQTLERVPKAFTTVKDLETLNWLHLALYYNSQIAPRLSPSGVPFQRQYLDLQVVRHIPQEVISFLTVLVRSFQHADNCLDKAGLKDYYKHLSLVYKTINDALSVPEQEAQALALGGILILMGSDINSRSFESWLVHSSAAKTLVRQLGGIGVCIQLTPQSLSLYVDFMMVNVLSTTMTNSRFISEDDVALQKSCIDYLKARVQEYLPSIIAIPKPCIQAVIRINILRKDYVVEDLKANNQDNIIRDVRLFNSSDWATKLSVMSHDESPLETCHKISPSLKAAWKHLGQAWKYAVLIYHSLVCSKEMPTTVSGSLLSFTEKLNSSMRFLLDNSSLSECATLEQQLWKYVAWPAFVLAYVEIGWLCRRGDDRLNYHLQQLIRFERSPYGILCSSIKEIANQILEYRTEFPFTPCGWDDGVEIPQLHSSMTCTKDLTSSTFGTGR